MSDELSEFTSIDVDEIHLVGMPANGVPEPLLAKAAEPAGPTKGSIKLSKKKIAKALGVNLSGRASTAADCQSTADLERLIRQAGSQTRWLSQDGGRSLRRVVKAFDVRVAEAHASVAAAANEFERGRAQEELRQALKSRCMMKMVVAENTGANKGNLPNTAALFGRGAACSTYSLADDPDVGGV